MGWSVHGDYDGARGAPSSKNAPWSRAMVCHASAGAIKSTGGDVRPTVLKASARKNKGWSVRAPARCRVFGAAGGSRSAHIMKLGPVGIEGLGEELAPEGAGFGEGARPSAAVAGRGTEGA